MLLVVYFLLFFVAVVKGINCPDDWTGHGNSCYMFIGTKQTWAEASILCEALGATLVKVDTAAENQFIQEHLRTFGDVGAVFNTWLGGNDIGIEGIWRWSPSGDRLSFTDWYPGEPEGNGDCLVMYQAHQYHWDDIRCSSQLNALCEKPSGTAEIIG